jgi:Ca-activated chloride channel family protein
MSASMRSKMRQCQQAAAELMRAFDHLEDEFFLVEFNERPKVSVPFTRERRELEQRLRRAKPVGRIALLDALHLAEAEMKKARSLRKAIVVLSDGGDNHSRYTQTEIHCELREADVQVYAVSIVNPPGSAPAPTPEEQDGPSLLGALTEETGGRHIELSNVEDLPGASARIARELHNQYSLGYSPSARDNSYHRLKVIVTSSGGASFKVYHRSSFYAAAP